MEGKVNYLVVGIFVATFLAGIFGFAFWLMKQGQYEKMDRYVVYFDESVAGLNKDASVKYMGVDAGVVEDIRVHPTNTNLVAVYLKINHDIKIREDMQATLKFYGMTGLAYVEIFGHDPHAPLLKPKKGEIPVIKSAPSIFAQLDVTLAKLAKEFSTITQKTERLLSDKNLRHLESTLAGVSAVTSELATRKEEIGNLIHNAALLESKAEQTLRKIDQLTGSFGPTFTKETKATLQSIRHLAREMEHALKRGDFDLRSLSEPTLRKFSSLIEHIDDLSNEMEETLHTFQQSPGDLLFKKSTPKPGPGE